MISQIVTRYKSRGLRGKPLREALLRHAAILTGCDPGAARELRARTNGMAGGRPKGCKSKPTRKETLDPIRAAWLEHDKRNGLTRD